MKRILKNHPEETRKLSVYSFNLSTREAEEGVYGKFETSLVYRLSSTTARALKRHPVSKNGDSFRTNINGNGDDFYFY